MDVTIAINTCYGGFGLSEEFKEKYPNFNDDTDPEDPDLIEALEEFGLDKASGEYANLKIARLKNVTDWMIQEEGGYETLYYVQNGRIFIY